MITLLRAALFVLPLVLLGSFTPDTWAAGAWLAGGLLMLVMAWRGQAWTAWASAPAWPGMTHDALFLRINRTVSGLWGLVFMLSGLAILLGAGPVLRWALMPVGGVISAALPAWWSRRTLTRRLRDADPNPWPSPLQAASAQALDADVVVIGAGLGGLTAAALLARAGQRVQVFEQHDKPGGFCHCWEGVGSMDGELPRFRFDAGVHDVSGYFPGGTVHALLARLGLSDALVWRRMDHAFVDDGGRWDVPRGWAAFVDALAARHPGQAPALRQALAEVKTIFEGMYSTAAARGGIPGQPSSVDALKAYAREHPLAVRWMTRPFAEFLAHHGVEGAAARTLVGLAGYVTHDAAALSVGQAVPLLGYFLHGGHYPVGGSGALSQALADVLAFDGGELHLGTAVAAIEAAPDGSGVRAVRLADGRRIRCRAVVMNGDALSARDLMRAGGAVPAALEAQLEGLAPAASMFSVHLGVRGQAPALPAIVHLHHAQGLAPLEVVLPSTVDAGASPPGTFTVELMQLLSPEEAATWFEDARRTDPTTQRASAAYQARKAALGDRLVALAEELVPDLRARTVFRREASPVTFRRYGYSSFGAVYGVTGPGSRLAPLPRRSAVPGLVFAGAAVRGPGAEPAMMAGAEAADALLPGLLAGRPGALPSGPSGDSSAATSAVPSSHAPSTRLAERS